MAFWTNYNPLTADQGYKSTTANINGYKLATGVLMGDFMIAIRDLMLASGNFVLIDENVISGSASSSQFILMGFGSSTGVASQQVMILLDSANVDGYTFQERIGYPTYGELAIGGRDMDHENTPEIIKPLHNGGNNQYGFFPNNRDTGSNASWQYNATFQEANIFAWSNENWIVFLIHWKDNIAWTSSQFILFRLDEPADGHYMRTRDGATHGLIYALNRNNNWTRLAGITASGTNDTVLSGSLLPIANASMFSPSQTKTFLLQKFRISHNNTIGFHLGTLDGIYWGSEWMNLSPLDIVTIDGIRYCQIGINPRVIPLFVQQESIS